ncbi:MAG TPA: hypothetical protein VEQ63_06780 [Bryobacteraceae bacterium]|nr:hypothetical protein [Bryobacteraceae bacterium]
MRLQCAAYWFAPFLLIILIYGSSLHAWFQLDDFAWLALRAHITNWDSLLSALFRPLAQGTIRPISERLFFLSLQAVFGLEALPFRLVVLTTFAGSVYLLARVTEILVNSSRAGLGAAIFWVVNANLFWSVAWNSAYNQILCSFLFLLSFLIFMRYIETGKVRYHIGHWSAFLLGFGVLELNVVYPAVVLLYAAIRSRAHVRKLVPMIGVAIIYVGVRCSLGLPQESSVYGMHLDSIVPTLFRYLKMSAGAGEYASSVGLGALPFACMQAAVLVALISFAVQRSFQRDWLPVFFSGWFLATLAPYLLLRDHVSDYYLTVPVIGLCMLGGYALTFIGPVFSRPALPHLAAVVVVCLYLVPSAWAARSQTAYAVGVSARVKNFVQRLAQASHGHSGKTILLQGVDNELFWSAVYYQPHRLFGLTDLYLTADSESLIGTINGAGSLAQ